MTRPTADRAGRPDRSIPDQPTIHAERTEAACRPETDAGRGEAAEGPRADRTALCVVVGSVIGSGIFIVPARVARNVPFLGGIALVWVVGGLFSMAGALTLAELSAMLPSAGGPYVYLREAFGRLPAFLFGWTEFLVIRTGSIATLAAAFGLYFALLVPAPGGIRRRWSGRRRRRVGGDRRRGDDQRPRHPGRRPGPGRRHGAEGRGARRDDRPAVRPGQGRPGAR